MRWGRGGKGISNIKHMTNQSLIKANKLHPKHHDYITSLENLVDGKLLSIKELLIKDVKWDIIKR
jgi:hypothetical protein